MKSLFITFFIMTSTLGLIADDSNQVVKHQGSEINGEMLKEWYDQKKPMVVLDARSKPYFDGKLLPSAKWLPCDSSQDQIIQAVPSKETTIVVYCLNPECPASRILSEKLRSLGYNNVYEYSEGIQDWVKRGYPTDQQ